MVRFRSVALGDRKISASLFPLFGIHLFRHVSSDWGGHSPRQCFWREEPWNAVGRHESHGWSVSDLSHWAIGRFPLPFFRFLEFIYFGMFPQIGAAILLASVSGGKNRGMQLVGTILMA